MRITFSATTLKSNSIMKISKIENFTIRYPDPNDLNRERMTLLVRIQTSDGIIGWGEAITMWPEACKATSAIIENGFAPLIINNENITIDEIWKKLREHSWWFGEGGITSFAISAIDMALWDIYGKIQNMPLSSIWGRVKEKLPANASCHVNKETLSDCINEVISFYKHGFKSTKLGFGKKSLGNIGKDPDSCISLVSNIRKELGDDFEILVDFGNGIKWDRLTVIDTVKKMADYNIGWIEEPFYPSFLDDYIALKKSINIPIASGEREWTVTNYQRLIDTKTVDILGIDPARAEGITGFREIDRRANLGGLTVNAHAWSTAITTAASLHLSLSSHCTQIFELKPFPVVVQNELIEEPITYKDGYVEALNKPGLGIQVDESVVRRLSIN
jgi:L-alanine-DL-glutamate epimerase-like enolase superfamily enzyme